MQKSVHIQRTPKKEKVLFESRHRSVPLHLNLLQSYSICSGMARRSRTHHRECTDSTIHESASNEQMDILRRLEEERNNLSDESEFLYRDC